MAEVVFTRTYVSRGVNTDSVPPTCSPSPPPNDGRTTHGSMLPPTYQEEPIEPPEVAVTPTKTHWMSRIKVNQGQLKIACSHGEIPGVPIGTFFETRLECAAAAVHGVLVAGVHGDRTNGAWSVVLSGGYDDDKDDGDTFTYTGCGGRNPSTSWDGKQIADQSWDKIQNAALHMSSTTQKPIRVIRGRTFVKYKRSKYMPKDGEPRYRYDGLYVVESVYQERGASGFLMCKCRFKRLPGQAPIPINETPTPKRRAVSIMPDTRLSLSSTPIPPSTPMPTVPTPAVPQSAPPTNKRSRGRPKGSAKKSKRPSGPETSPTPVSTPVAQIPSIATPTDAASISPTTAKARLGKGRLPKKRPTAAEINREVFESFGTPGPSQSTPVSASFLPSTPRFSTRPPSCTPTIPSSSLSVPASPTGFGGLPATLAHLCPTDHRAQVPLPSPSARTPSLSPIATPKLFAVLPTTPSSAPTVAAGMAKIKKEENTKSWFETYLQNGQHDTDMDDNPKDDVGSFSAGGSQGDDDMPTSALKLEFGCKKEVIKGVVGRGVKRPFGNIENVLEGRYSPRPRLG